MLHKPLTEEEAFSAFASGDEKGFDYFFKSHFGSLCYFGFRLLNDKAIAEDVVMESFYKLWQRRSLIQKPASIKSYLYIIVRNACLEVLRRQKKSQLEQNELAYLADEVEEPVQREIVYAEMMHSIYTAIQNLPPQCSKVFRMLYQEGKGYQQIADEMQLSISTVRNQKARALLLLKQKLLFGIILLCSISFL